jgi:hypothetical protein
LDRRSCIVAILTRLSLTFLIREKAAVPGEEEVILAVPAGTKDLTLRERKSWKGQHMRQPPEA